MVKIWRTRQVLAAILAALSVGVSSVAACACTHQHNKPVEAEVPACHRQTDQPDKAAISESAEASCQCVLQALAPKAFVKNENKNGKQAIASTPAGPVAEFVVTGSPDMSGAFFSTEILVSTTFYNLTPGRAPPRL